MTQRQQQIIPKFYSTAKSKISRFYCRRVLTYILQYYLPNHSCGQSMLTQYHFGNSVRSKLIDFFLYECTSSRTVTLYWLFSIHLVNLIRMLDRALAGCLLSVIFVVEAYSTTRHTPSLDRVKIIKYILQKSFKPNTLFNYDTTSMGIQYLQSCFIFPIFYHNKRHVYIYTDLTADPPHTRRTIEHYHRRL